MGITGELVRSVFSKSRSVGAYESNVKTSGVEKRKWSSVRTYLCGDEFNSVIAEEGSASYRSSEATNITRFTTQQTQESSEASVTQPILEDLNDKAQDFQSEETKEEKKLNSTARLFREDDAATAIQSAFRRFLARRENEGIRLRDSKEGSLKGMGSPSRESVGTSIEVQTGNSVEVLSVREESLDLPHKFQQKARAQVLKLKEDWDDSTVSSNISRMRIQCRLEASTRRERALAYAFSQQLRICSKKKQTEEPNMGWNWLERWMATRIPETSSIESGVTKQLETININQRSSVRKRLFDVAVEEKESCGSNEVSFQFDSVSVSSQKQKIGLRPAMNRLKATRGVSRRKTVPSHHYLKEYNKVCKKECESEDEKEGKKHKQKKQSGSKREVKSKDSTSHLSPETEISNNFNLDV